jgi:hypothetical protein
MSGTDSERNPVVLVVEDEALVRAAALSIVEESGFEAIGAGSADEAIGALETGSDIHAVFTDVSLGQLLPANDLGAAEHLERHASPSCRTEPGSFPNLTWLSKLKRFCAICSNATSLSPTRSKLEPTAKSALPQKRTIGRALMSAKCPKADLKRAIRRRLSLLSQRRVEAPYAGTSKH